MVAAYNALNPGMVTTIEVCTSGQGLFEFTDRLREVVSGAGVEDGLCTLMVQHTSASLTSQENADPSSRRDLEQWLDRLVAERKRLRELAALEKA